MRKILFVLCFLLGCVFVTSAQNLYRGIHKGMIYKEAKKEVKANPNLYKDICFGGGVCYDLLPSKWSLICDDNGKIKELRFHKAKGTAFIAANGYWTHQDNEVHVNKTLDGLIEKGWNLLYENDNVRSPILYEAQQGTGAVFLAPNKETVAKITPFTAWVTQQYLYGTIFIISSYEDYLASNKVTKSQQNAELQNNGF